MKLSSKSITSGIIVYFGVDLILSFLKVEDKTIKYGIIGFLIFLIYYFEMQRNIDGDE